MQVYRYVYLNCKLGRCHHSCGPNKTHYDQSSMNVYDNIILSPLIFTSCPGGIPSTTFIIHDT